MAAQPLLSVLITAYNRENFIAEAIESVLASTYTHFELIICDDCSTDNTYAIAQKYAAQDPRIKLYRNEKNLGDFPNRDKSASLASAKYLKYVDSDDIITPWALAKMVEAMEKFPEAALGLSQINNEINLPLDYPVLITPERAYLEHYYGYGTLRYGPTGAIIKKEILTEMGGFGNNRFVGDTELWLKIVAKYPMVKIEPDIVKWRKHTGQEFYLGHLYHFYIRKAYKIYVESLRSPGCPLQQEDIDRIMTRLQWKHAKDILKLAFKKRHPILAMKIFMESGFGLRQLLKGFLPYSKIKKTFYHSV